MALTIVPVVGVEFAAASPSDQRCVAVPVERVREHLFIRRVDVEYVDAKKDEWFNPAKRLWFYSTDWWRRQGRVRSYLGGRTRRPQHPHNEGQQVEYEIISDRGKKSAGNLKVK